MTTIEWQYVRKGGGKSRLHNESRYHLPCPCPYPYPYPYPISRLCHRGIVATVVVPRHPVGGLVGAELGELHPPLLVGDDLERGVHLEATVVGIHQRLARRKVHPGFVGALQLGSLPKGRFPIDGLQASIRAELDRGGVDIHPVVRELRGAVNEISTARKKLFPSNRGSSMQH